MRHRVALLTSLQKKSILRALLLIPARVTFFCWFIFIMAAGIPALLRRLFASGDCSLGVSRSIHFANGALSA